ncbi:Carboxypeptidase D, partial [Tetrabaena socialis]
GDIPYCPSADEPLPGLLASAYASANPTMRANAEEPFVNGTVQGAVWYSVLGSMQDWTYYALGRLQLTLELHEVKRLAAASLPALWGANAASMLRLMELSHMGLRARVLDASTRNPLSANVTITQPSGVRGTTASAARGGYLYKMMAPGQQYTFVVRPYDPARPKLSYEDMTLSVRLGMRAEDLVGGRGMAGMAVKRLLLAVRKPTKRK